KRAVPRRQDACLKEPRSARILLEFDRWRALSVYRDISLLTAPHFQRKPVFRQSFNPENGDLTAMPKSRELAQANLENIYRIFTVPEAPDSTLGRVDQAISDDLMGFLQEHIVAVERDLDEIEGDFSKSSIPEEPT